MIINPTVLKARKAGISKHDLLAVAVLKCCASAVPRKWTQGITVTSTQITVLPSWTQQTSADVCAHPQSQFQDVLPTQAMPCCARHFPFWVATSILFVRGWKDWNRFLEGLLIGLAIPGVVSQGSEGCQNRAAAFITWSPSTLKPGLPCHTQTQSYSLKAEDCFYELMQPWNFFFKCEDGT